MDDLAKGLGLIAAIAKVFPPIWNLVSGLIDGDPEVVKRVREVMPEKHPVEDLADRLDARLRGGE